MPMATSDWCSNCEASAAGCCQDSWKHTFQGGESLTQPPPRGLPLGNGPANVFYVEDAVRKVGSKRHLGSQGNPQGKDVAKSALNFSYRLCLQDI